MKTRITIVMLSAIVAMSAMPLAAAGYSKAEITRLHNDVKVLKENVTPKTASVGLQINPVSSVATGPESRAELRFPDQSLTRLGANSRFTLRGDSRTLDLDQGVMLLQVPEQIRGAKVRTAAVTAAVTGGTALIEYLPGGYVKMIVIEGYVDVFMNSDPSQYKQFGPGKMMIMKSDGTFIPDGVEVDLKVLLKTSKMLSNNDDSSINQDLVQDAVNQQQQQIQNGDLAPTNLLLPGKGTLVVVDTSQVNNLFNNFGIRDGQPPPGQQPGQGNPQNINLQQLHQDQAAFQGFAPLINGKTVLNDNSSIRTNPHVRAYNVKSGEVITSEGTIYDGKKNGLLQFHVFGDSRVISPALQAKLNEKGAWALFRFEDLFINGSPTWEFPVHEGGEGIGEGGFEFPEEQPVRNIILASNNGIRIGGLNQFQDSDIPLDAGGNQEPPTEGEAVLDLYQGYSYENLESLVLISNNGSITLRSDPEGFAISGYNQDVSIIAAGLTSDVNIEGGIALSQGQGEGEGEGEGGEGVSNLNVVAGQDVNVTSTNVVATNVNMTAGRNVTVTNGVVRANGNLNIKAGLNINVSNSSQLKALLDSTAVLRLEGQGNGNPANNTINLDDVRLDSSGRIELQANTGSITMNQMTACSDVFKATTLSPNGWIVIGNSTITARTLLELYGGSATGGVRFVADSTLDGGQVNISGHTVEVLQNVQVSVPKGRLSINAADNQYRRSDQQGGPLNKGIFNVGTINQ